MEAIASRIFVPSKQPTGDTCPVWREDGHRYHIRRIPWWDSARQAAFQRLRAQVFVGKLGWDIPVSLDGREYDRYDGGGGRAITVEGVFGADDEGVEHLLAGVRIFQLRTWDDSMLAHEFMQNGMVPAGILDQLDARFEPSELLELTRLCVYPRRGTLPLGGVGALSVRTTSNYAGAWAPARTNTCEPPQYEYDLAAARDLCYGAVYCTAEATQRRFVLGIVDSRYLRIMRRAHFAFEELYSRDLDVAAGYAVVITDLVQTIRALEQAGQQIRAARMLALCRNPDAFHSLRAMHSTDEQAGG